VMGRKKNTITNTKYYLLLSLHSNYAHGAPIHHTNNHTTWPSTVWI